MNISNEIIKRINQKKIYNPKINFLCIGTDRVIGDSLGPIIGTKIEKFVKLNKIKNVEVLGSLDKNINNDSIERYEFNNLEEITIAIDSAISNTYKIGEIIIDSEKISLREALYERKYIENSINIKCIVAKNYNESKKNFIMLQNVRLGIILNMAEKIANELCEVLEYYNTF